MTDKTSMSDPVLVAGGWRTNGQLIADVARLHFPPDPKVLDPTYGEGNWWTNVAIPRSRFVAHDLELDGCDFRNLPHRAGTFDVVAFDPPYVARGGRKSAGEELGALNDAYGLVKAPKSPTEMQKMIDDGLTECVRVLAPRGVLLVKCQNYVSSGKVWPGAHKTWAAAEKLPLDLIDEFVFVTPNPRPQPSHHPNGTPRKQKHARSNASVLLVFRKKAR